MYCIDNLLSLCVNIGNDELKNILLAPKELTYAYGLTEFKFVGIPNEANTLISYKLKVDKDFVINLMNSSFAATIEELIFQNLHNLVFNDGKITLDVSCDDCSLKFYNRDKFFLNNYEVCNTIFGIKMHIFGDSTGILLNLKLKLGSDEFEFVINKCDVRFNDRPHIFTSDRTGISLFEFFENVYKLFYDDIVPKSIVRLFDNFGLSYHLFKSKSIFKLCRYCDDEKLAKYDSYYCNENCFNNKYSIFSDLSPYELFVSMDFLSFTEETFAGYSEQFKNYYLEFDKSRKNKNEPIVMSVHNRNIKMIKMLCFDLKKLGVKFSVYCHGSNLAKFHYCEFIFDAYDIKKISTEIPVSVVSITNNVVKNVRRNAQISFPNIAEHTNDESVLLVSSDDKKYN